MPCPAGLFLVLLVLVLVPLLVLVLQLPLIASQACCALLDAAPSIGVVYLDMMATVLVFGSQYHATMMCCLLVFVMQVPLIASQACCALLDTAPSIGIVYLDILATKIAYKKSMWAPLPDRDTLTPTKLSIAVTKQLEQSGVLNYLGRVFGMVADELQAHKPSAATVLKMTNDQQPEQDDELHTHIGVIMHVQQVWDVYLALINMWPERQTVLWKFPDIQVRSGGAHRGGSWHCCGLVCVVSL